MFLVGATAGLVPERGVAVVKITIEMSAATLITVVLIIALALSATR
jgi:hypothetical protein